MSSKILVADDSLTIQKVISITLSSSDYNLVTANSYQELVEKLKEGDINLVLLDFNLSENIDGYALAKKIKELSADSQIIMMYGTFDNVDEGQLNDSEVFDKVIKPFESSLFIQKCTEALGETNISSVAGIETNDLEVSPSQESENLSNMENVFTNDDNWVMSSPKMEDESENISLSGEDSNLKLMETAVEGDGNFLRNEIEDWGMSIPSKIGENEDGVSLPPEIAGEKIEISALDNDEDDTDEVIELSADLLENREKPELQSIHELVLDEDETEMPIQLDTSITEPEGVIENEVEELTKEVEDEIDAENFWATDDDTIAVETSDLETTQEFIPAGLDTHNVDSDETTEFEVSEFQNEVMPNPQASIEEENIVEALFEKVKPLLDQKIEEYIKKHLDSSAWEIIPDLAENVIKEEVRRISDSVLESSSSSLEE